ncbi:hypothetical protein, partial [Mesorhizobium sp. LNJC394B00]|uniref:hypothetical protein n=1 Tax=Mesorhizobium sp. LNJC394B00 TaxID=1287274 RepID=UPI001AEBF677
SSLCAKPHDQHHGRPFLQNLTHTTNPDQRDRLYEWIIQWQPMGLRRQHERNDQACCASRSKAPWRERGSIWPAGRERLTKLLAEP